MGIISRLNLGLIAAAALVAATPAAAQTATPNGPITIRGLLHLSILGGMSYTQCQMTLQGTADSGGFTVSKVEGENINGGPLSCDDWYEHPIRIDATSPNEVIFRSFTIRTPFGDCEATNFSAAWSNQNSSMTIPMQTIIIPCELGGTLTVSPATTIN